MWPDILSPKAHLDHKDHRILANMIWLTKHKKIIVI